MLGESSIHTDFIFPFPKHKPWGYKPERDCSALWPSGRSGRFKAAGAEGTSPATSPSSAAAMLETQRQKGRQHLLQDQLVLERRRQLFSTQAPLKIYSKYLPILCWFVWGTFVFKLSELVSTEPCFCLQSGTRLSHSQTAAAVGPVGLALHFLLQALK